MDPFAHVSQRLESGRRFFTRVPLGSCLFDRAAGLLFFRQANQQVAVRPRRTAKSFL